jgi:hypothetical protein
MDMLYLQLLKHTREMGSQFNKYWHGALTPQPHIVFPPFCVYLICNFIYFCLFVKITKQTSKPGYKAQYQTNRITLDVHRYAPSHIIQWTIQSSLCCADVTKTYLSRSQVSALQLYLSQDTHINNENLDCSH